MKSDRRERVADLVKSVIAEKLVRGARDERFRLVTVTGVEMAPDLKRARVAVSFLPGVENREEILEALNKAGGYLKRAMGRQLRLKFTPNLVFEIDRTADRQARIEELLDRIHDENARG